MDANPSAWNFWELTHFFAPKIYMAVLCGGIIGFERELKNKAAGIKTNILICVGSALYTSVGILIARSFSENGHFGDPGRIAAQIVSGIGFLGGGTIIQSRGTILGLTTAATIWVVAAIGLCIGIGHSDIGLASAITVVAVLVAINFFEDKVLGRSISFACDILVDDPQGHVRAAINQALSRNDLILDDFDMVDKSGHSHLSMKYRGHRNDHKKFVLDLWGTPGIREVKQR